MKGKIEIKNLAKGEINFIKAMLYQALFVAPGSPPFPESILEESTLKKYYANWGNSPYDLAIVAMDGDKRIGLVWGRIYSKENPSYGFIDEQTPEINIAVLEAYRNQGIGQRLMQNVEQAYRQLGIENLSLSVDKLNPAKRLYVRMGYKIISEEKTAFTMTKNILD